MDGTSTPATGPSNVGTSSNAVSSTDPAVLARAEVDKYCAMFSEVPQIGRSEIVASPGRFCLIDCRTSAETAVSMIKGAILQSDFEKLDPEDETHRGKTLVPYCTVGYRSGTYARYLQKTLESRGVEVRNGEGVLMWIHDGGELVTQTPTGEEVVTVVHTFGPPWDHAPERYRTVKFGSLGMAWHGAMFKWSSSKWKL